EGRPLRQQRLQRARPRERGIEQADQALRVDLVERVALRFEPDLLEPDLRELARELAAAVQERRVLLLEVGEPGLVLEVLEIAIRLRDLALEGRQRLPVEQIRGAALDFAPAAGRLFLIRRHERVHDLGPPLGRGMEDRDADDERRRDRLDLELARERLDGIVGGAVLLRERRRHRAEDALQELAALEQRRLRPEVAVPQREASRDARVRRIGEQRLLGPNLERGLGAVLRRL